MAPRIALGVGLLHPRQPDTRARTFSQFRCSAHQMSGMSATVGYPGFPAAVAVVVDSIMGYAIRQCVSGLSGGFAQAFLTTTRLSSALRKAEPAGDPEDQKLSRGLPTASVSRTLANNQPIVRDKLQLSSVISVFACVLFSITIPHFPINLKG